MVAVDSRNTVWYFVFLVLLGVGGMCVVGYWMTFDIQCFGGQRVWVWTKVPPGFECRALF